MWSNMWSKAILDQSRGEVKKKKCQRRNGFLGLSDSAANLVLRLPKRGYQKLQFLERKIVLGG